MRRSCCLPTHRRNLQTDLSSGTAWSKSRKQGTASLPARLKQPCPVNCPANNSLPLCVSYVKDNFVDKGMCADFAIHDKGTGNPHVHIMLTAPAPERKWRMGRKVPQGIRPGRKRPAYPGRERRLEEPPGGYHRLEQQRECGDLAGGMGGLYQPGIGGCRSARRCVDHRSYKRQGIDKIPSVHLGPAASQMEKRGIRTDKGEVNRQIAADNKLLKEIKARITRLYRWSKAETEKPQTQQSSLTALWEAQQQLNAPRTRTGKIRALQESAALFSFLQANGIQSMQQLHEKIADMNTRYYDLRRRDRQG